MRTACCLLLLVAVGSIHAQPLSGDEIVDYADVEFELVVKKATPSSDGRHAALGKLRFHGFTPAGQIVTGDGTVRMREVSGYDPSRGRQISGSGLLNYQGAVGEVYGDGSYDLGLYGELQAVTLEARPADYGVIRAKHNIIVGRALVRPPND